MHKKQELYGVNLGGWLVLEKWLTPSLFEGTTAADEFTLCTQMGDAKYDRLRAHRDTFITEVDFKTMQQHGVNALRLPIGYWVFNDTGPYVACADYVDWTIAIAAKYDIAVLLDLHAAPGSQNGWDHSGKSGEMAWHTDQQHITATLDVLGQLAERYGKAPNLWGIEVLNEPRWDIPEAVLVDFYQQAYRRIRQHAPESVAVVVSDSFRPSIWHDTLQPGEYKNVVIDCHFYQVFTDEDKALSIDEHSNKVRGEWAHTIQDLQRHHPVIIGEWSAALDSGTTGLTPDATKQYLQAQKEVFAQTAGHFYWTYKKEQADDWDFGNIAKYY